MDDQQSHNNQSDQHKSFGAPRMRATQLLDVLRSDGQDVSELSEELENASYADENGEYVPPEQRAKKDTHLAGTSNQPDPLSAYGFVANAGKKKAKPSSAGKEVPNIGSFSAEGSDAPPPIGSFTVPNNSTPPVGSFKVGGDTPPIGSFSVPSNDTPPVGSFRAGGDVPSVGSFKVGGDDTPPVGSFSAGGDDTPAVGSFRVGGDDTPPIGSFSVPGNNTPPVGSFRAGGDDTPPVGSFRAGGVSSSNLDALADIDNVDPQFDPNSAMAKLAALAGGSSQPNTHTSMGHRRPRAGNPSMQQDEFYQPEFDEFELLNNASADFGGHPSHASSLGAGADYAASYAEQSPRSSRASFSANVQHEIDRMATDFTNDIYANEPNPYVSPAQRRQQRNSQPTFKDVEAESLYPVENLASHTGPTITTNYITAKPTPVPTFTPNAFTSPFEDYANNQVASSVVDGEVLPLDFDPAEALANEQYQSILANKQAAMDLQMGQSTSSFHPWTLEKNRMSRIEIKQIEIAESDPKKSVLIPRNRISLDARGAMELALSRPEYAQPMGVAMPSGPTFAPPPEGHLLAVDAAMGLPVDNPLLLQSEGGHVIGVIDLNGGMLAQLMYQRETGPLMDLLYHAPWLKDNYYFRMPNLEQHMAGEWPCVPFGWSSQKVEANRPEAQHGFACQGKWNLEAVLRDKAEFLKSVESPSLEPYEAEESEDGGGFGVMLNFDYPEDYPLQRIKRTIFIGDTEVLFNFTLFPREDCKVPMAAYPLFPMHPDNDRIMLDIDGDGIVYPRQYEPGVSRFMPKSHFLSLEAIALRQDFVNKDGNSFAVDATVLPFSYPTEEVIQMLNPKGRARLYYPNKQLHLVLKWDEEKLPNCVVWISNAGRSYHPWNGESYCLGVAPMIGTWDMSDEALKPNNLIEQYGQRTFAELKAGEPFSFSYSLFIEDLQPDEPM